MADKFTGRVPTVEPRVLDEPIEIPPLKPLHCDYCGGRHGDQFRRFCSDKCRIAWWRMAERRGKKIYALAYLERRFRNDPDLRKWAMNGRCRILDLYIAEDREAEAKRYHGSDAEAEDRAAGIKAGGKCLWLVEPGPVQAKIESVTEDDDGDPIFHLAFTSHKDVEARRGEIAPMKQKEMSK